MSFCTTSSVKRRPIKRLTAYSVFFGLVTAWRLALWPTRISSSSVYATIDGVVRAPSAFSNHLDLVAIEDGHAGVRGAEVNTDNLCHGFVSEFQIFCRPSDAEAAAVKSIACRLYWPECFKFKPYKLKGLSVIVTPFRRFSSPHPWRPRRSPRAADDRST